MAERRIWEGPVDVFDGAGTLLGRAHAVLRRSPPEGNGGREGAGAWGGTLIPPPGIPQWSIGDVRVRAVRSKREAPARLDAIVPVLPEGAWIARLSGESPPPF